MASAPCFLVSEDGSWSCVHSPCRETLRLLLPDTLHSTECHHLHDLLDRTNYHSCIIAGGKRWQDLACSRSHASQFNTNPGLSKWTPAAAVRPAAAQPLASLGAGSSITSTMLVHSSPGLQTPVSRGAALLAHLTQYRDSTRTCK